MTACFRTLINQIVIDFSKVRFLMDTHHKILAIFN